MLTRRRVRGFRFLLRGRITSHLTALSFPLPIAPVWSFASNRSCTRAYYTTRLLHGYYTVYYLKKTIRTLRPTVTQNREMLALLVR
mgnify:CR=1 FL=1